jgi:hypothetical protein
MGTWGFNVLDDDAALDVYEAYLERFNAGESHERILAKITADNAEMVKDADEGPVFWLGVARAQWDCGALSAGVLKRVEQIVERGEGLDRWEEAGATSAERRRKLLAVFLSKLRSLNPRPKKRRKAIVRKPVFSAGDCLAIRLSDGDYAAAVVLACPPEQPRPGAETYGLNVIGLLEYKSPERPGQEVFEGRRWLRLTHHSWGNQLAVYRFMSLRFRSVKDRFEVVGATRIRRGDPEDSGAYAGWDFAEQVVLQATWDRGVRDNS